MKRRLLSIILIISISLLSIGCTAESVNDKLDLAGELTGTNLDDIEISQEMIDEFGNAVSTGRELLEDEEVKESIHDTVDVIRDKLGKE